VISEHRPLARSTTTTISPPAGLRPSSSARVLSACRGRDLDRRLAITTASGVDFGFDGLLQRLRLDVDPPFVRRCDGTLGALARLLLDTALRVREARSDRLAFASDFSENFKWSCVLLMGLMAQISLAAVHLDEARAQFAAMVIFTTSIVRSD
jgi:hypothetical protein